MSETGISQGVVHKILRKDLKLRRKTAKYVPHLLTPLNLRCRLEICQMMLRIIRNKPSLLRRIVTMDESFVYMYDLELKGQSSQWLGKDDPRPQKVRRERAVGKTLLISFFDWKGVVHQEFLRNQTVTSTIFVQILGRLRESMKRRRPRVKYQLHMDNASPHTADITQLHLIHSGVRTVPHPPYSPDLAPSDFFFYPRLKKNLRGRRFRTLDDLEHAVDMEIGKIRSEEFKDCMEFRWPMRWCRCVNKNGDYFEGLDN